MRSNYKKLGKYIQPVNVRNTDLKVETLLGVSINKVLMPSIANTVGTNMKTYKIIKRNQFAYGPVTSRNGNKISVALLEDHNEAIVSQAYTVFEVKDEAELHPEYLMMWMRRPEFDRYARFKSHGSAREVFDWDEMCDVQLPIPSTEKQKEIVTEYNTIKNRIALNNQLIQKLEETAQAIYKQWFVDFEFPISEADIEGSRNGSGSVLNNSLLGKPYKSSGGKMVWNEELEKEIPEGWVAKTVKDFCTDMKSGGTPNRGVDEYWDANDYPWLKTGELKNSVVLDSEEYISERGLNESSAKILPINSVLIAMYGEGNTKGQVGYLKVSAATNQACCAMVCENESKSTYLYYHLRINRDDIVSVAIGGAQPNLSKNIIEDIPILEPSDYILNKHPFKQIMALKEKYTSELKLLNKTTDVLHSKLATIEN